MKINLYGVGRSGTKALQLYLAYHLAREEGAVWVNYEPYFWQTKEGREVTYEGLAHHLAAPQFAANPSAFDGRHRNYLRKMADHGPQSVITKFIRGCGRRSAIDELQRPDLTIVIVRDLYEVLASMGQMDWNYYSVGYRYFPRTYADFWERLVRESREFGLWETPTGQWPWSPDQVTRNAFYWYVMNKHLLRQVGGNLWFVDYADLPQLRAPLAAKLGFELEDLGDKGKFDGENLHSGFPLRSVRPRSTIRAIGHRWNELRYLYARRRLPLWPIGVGATATVGEVPAQTPKELRRPRPNIHIDRQEVLDAWNQEIREEVRRRSILQSPDQKPSNE